MRDTEDKLAWCADGIEREIDFVERIAPRLKLNAKINPEKKTNPFAPDLLVNEKMADLKSQTTPFFTARKAFKAPQQPGGIDPQYAVTFNRKDYLRYREQYPELDIYFWVEWKELENYGTKVRPLIGVYRVPFSQLAAHIESGEAKLHTYQRRESDQMGNARDSYGFDVRNFETLYQAFQDEDDRTLTTAFAL